MSRTAMATLMVACVSGAAGSFVLLATDAAQAQAGSVVVRGNQRVEAATVKSYIVGRGQSAAEIDESLKALYATGLFSDVKIAREGGSLVVTVVESPLINKIAFEGNKRLQTEQLSTVIESKSRGFLSQTRVQRDAQQLLEVYRRSGRFRATVEPKIISLPQNRVDLVFEIDEGDKTAVSRIDFVGNHAFSDGRLRDVVKTRETGLLGFLRTTDTYDPDRLNADQEQIRRFYLKNGYADFRMVAASADLDRERNVFFVSFTVDEGDQYKFGDIDVQTGLPELDGAALKKMARTKAGDVYNADLIEKTIEDITIEASKRGYAFAQVRPRAVRDYATKTISLTYYVDEGARVYIDRINVRGNNRTREYVIRREFDIAEGDAYNRALINRAERRLKNLGFFKDVKIRTEPTGQPDRVIVNVDVEEQSTGEIGFGVGYSSADGVLGDISLTERNFLGRGQFVRASISRGSNSSGYTLSFTEPYFLGQRITAGFDLYKKTMDAVSYRPYEEETFGGGIRFGLPITENLTIGTGWQVFERKITLTDRYSDGDFSNGEASLAYKLLVGNLDTSGPVVTYTGDKTDKSLYSVPSVNVVYNTLDSMQFPRDGIYAKTQLDFAGAGGDVTYAKLTAEGRYYKELYADWGLIGMLRGKGGYINGLGDDVRAVDNFFIGGETIRGFAPNGIGPRDVSKITSADNGGYGDKTLNQGLGGDTYWAVTAEAMAPMPGTPEEFGLYWSVFADAGQVFGVSDAIKDLNGRQFGSNGSTFDFKDDNAIRSSVGFGILWRSPFGPLRGDFGFPITKGKYDQTQIFRFSGGTQF